jgi:uncharacterized membrane protein
MTAPALDPASSGAARAAMRWMLAALYVAAGITMAIYALCVWPANFKHALDGIDLRYVSSSWLYHGPRLALQPVIMWWALYCAGVIDWPWRRRAIGARS